MLDNERHNSQRDASEFAFWCLAELQNPTLKLMGKWVHQSQDSTGQRPVQQFDGFQCNLDPARPTAQVRLEDLLAAILCEQSPADYELPSGQRDVVLFCRDVVDAPELLPIKITRNVVDAASGLHKKLHTPVEVPLTIDVEVKTEISPEGEQESCTHVYRLKAVVVHAGHSGNSGHYTCFVQVNCEAPALNGWHHFDDQRASSLELARGDWLESSVVKEGCCVLFYERFSAPDPAAAVDSQVTFLLFFFNRIVMLYATKAGLSCYTQQKQKRLLLLLRITFDSIGVLSSTLDSSKVGTKPRRW
jgi:hypothetical protein